MPPPHVASVPLRWSDMDAYGHVNNVQFLRLLEDARVVGFREWFAGNDVVASGAIVTRHEIEYHAQLTYRPAPVEVDMWVTRIHGAGFDLGYAVRDPRSAGGTLYARAATGLAFYDFDAGRPRRVTREEKAVLTAYLAGPVPFRWRRDG